MYKLQGDQRGWQAGGEAGAEGEETPQEQGPAQALVGKCTVGQGLGQGGLEWGVA